MYRYDFTGHELDCWQSFHFRNEVRGEFSGRRISWTEGPGTLIRTPKVSINIQHGQNAQQCAELGTQLFRLGFAREAMQEFRRGVRLEPDSALAHSFLVIGHDYSGDKTARRVAELRAWAAKHARPKMQFTQWMNSRDTARKLRIGYVSGDFFRHSAFHTWFPVIREHDRDRFEIVCYYTQVVKDDYTWSLRPLVDEWRDVAELDDADFSRMVRDDQIDILVDLSCHTSGNRLRAFACHPAPLQTVGFGFVEGNGLNATDFLWHDSELISLHEQAYTGKPAHELPACFFYEPPADMPTVAPPPSSWGEPLTFGCFNKLDKISNETLAIWGDILRNVPQSRLLLKDPWYNDLLLRTQLANRMRAVGIDLRRVTLYGESSHTIHCSFMDEVDIALDPFPHVGGTSTAEMLWQGVPVVSLRGENTSSRTSSAILRKSGLGVLVALNKYDYATIACTLAHEPKWLEQARHSMRQRLLGSPVCNIKQIVRAVEEGYINFWRQWTEKNPCS